MAQLIQKPPFTDSEAAEVVLRWLRAAQCRAEVVSSPPSRCPCCDQDVSHECLVELLHVPTAARVIGGGSTYVSALNRCTQLLIEKLNREETPLPAALVLRVSPE